jgi:hypothetical protein
MRWQRWAYLVVFAPLQSGCTGFTVLPFDRAGLAESIVSARLRFVTASIMEFVAHRPDYGHFFGSPGAHGNVGRVPLGGLKVRRHASRRAARVRSMWGQTTIPGAIRSPETAWPQARPCRERGAGREYSPPPVSASYCLYRHRRAARLTISIHHTVGRASRLVAESLQTLYPKWVIWGGPSGVL